MSTFHPQNSNLFEINYQNNYAYSCIIKNNFLSSNKLYFTKGSTINLPKLVEVYNDNTKKKKVAHYHKDFHYNQYIYLSKTEIDKDKFLLPFFELSEFKCLACNKFHNTKTEQCCQMLNSSIEVISGKLTRCHIVDDTNFKPTLAHIREEFLRLHFPDILDKIILR